MVFNGLVSPHLDQDYVTEAAPPPHPFPTTPSSLRAPEENRAALRRDSHRHLVALGPEPLPALTATAASPGRDGELGNACAWAALLHSVDSRTQREMVLFFSMEGGL